MKKYKIGVFSPASNVLGIFPHRTQTGIANLKDLGFEVVFAKHFDRYNSAYKQSVLERLEEFHELLDQDVDLLMASIGGHTSIQLLDQIDYKEIKKKHIPICGFSDITALLLAVHTKTSEEMLYGPVYTVNLCDCGGVDEYTRDGLLACMRGEEINYQPSSYVISEYIDWNELEKKDRVKSRVSKKDDWIMIRSGDATGRLIGGNLATMMLILNTEYLPIEQFNDRILFLEDCNTNILEFCSYLECLKLHGVLDRIKGLVVGKFDTDDMNDEIQDFLKDYTEDLDIPVVCNVDFGHVFPILTLPIGRRASLTCNDTGIKFVIHKKNK